MEISVNPPFFFASFFSLEAGSRRGYYCTGAKKIWIWSKTVSYTHLDVYKRQALRLVIAEIRVVHVHEQRDQAGEEQHHKEEKLRLFAEPVRNHAEEQKH